MLATEPQYTDNQALLYYLGGSDSFAISGNDVANGIGPLAAVVSIVQSGGEVSQKAGLPLWILVVGGGGIVVGLATMGYKVMKSIGTRITELTPSRGYCATLAAATVLGMVLLRPTGEERPDLDRVVAILNERLAGLRRRQGMERGLPLARLAGATPTGSSTAATWRSPATVAAPKIPSP